MKFVNECKVIVGDVFLHPIVIRYEEDGKSFERLTSAEEILKLLEKAAQQSRALDVCLTCGRKVKKWS